MSTATAAPVHDANGFIGTPEAQPTGQHGMRPAYDCQVRQLLHFASCALVVLVACGPVTTPSQFVAYRYTADVPAGPFAPGEVVRVTWVPSQLSTTKSDVYEIELCAGFFGPWDSPQALKDQNKPMSRPACPLPDAQVAGEPAHSRSNIGARLTTDLIAPAMPGFYDLRQIVITGGNATVAGSVVEVRPR